MEIGTIKSLWRYPVKSLVGETLDNLEINARGVVGDRGYAILNREGKIGSGKNTRRYVRTDGLLSLGATKTEAGISISFPDGTTLSDKDERIDVKLSTVIGQEVSLSRENETSYFDDSAVLILTSRTLSALAKELPNSEIDERRFRANIVVDTAHSDDELVGRVLKIGAVALNVTHRCERCRMITLEQIGISNRPEILKTVAKKYGLLFGCYASVLSTGAISVGNKVELLSTQP